jgi:hypothetical protein
MSRSGHLVQAGLGGPAVNRQGSLKGAFALKSGLSIGWRSFELPACTGCQARAHWNVGERDKVTGFIAPQVAHPVAFEPKTLGFEEQRQPEARSHTCRRGRGVRGKARISPTANTQNRSVECRPSLQLRALLCFVTKRCVVDSNCR